MATLFHHDDHGTGGHSPSGQGLVVRVLSWMQLMVGGFTFGLLLVWLGSLWGLSNALPVQALAGAVGAVAMPILTLWSRR